MLYPGLLLCSSAVRKIFLLDFCCCSALIFRLRIISQQLLFSLFEAIENCTKHCRCRIGDTGPTDIGAFSIARHLRRSHDIANTVPEV